MAALSLLLPLPLLTAGCGGGGGGSSAAPLGGSFAGHAYSASSLALGALLGSLQVTTSATTRIATGTLTTTPAAQPAARRAAAVQSLNGLPNCRGTFDPATGALQLSGSVTDATGASHTFAISGTFPLPPSAAGSFLITLDGVAYGPFTFSDNSGATGGTDGTGGTGSGTTQTSVTISGSTANASNAQNGPFNGVATASKEVGAFTLGGVTYDGQYNVEDSYKGGILSVEIFGTDVSVGQTFSATDARFHSDFLDIATGRFDMDGGTVQVTALTDQSITLKLTDVHYTASPGGASGGFTVNGTITAPLGQG